MKINQENKILKVDYEDRHLTNEEVIMLKLAVDKFTKVDVKNNYLNVENLIMDIFKRKK